MKVLFLISGDRTPSCRFRVLPYVDDLRARGHRVTVASSFPQKYDYFPWLGFRPSQLLKRLTRWWHLLRARLARYDVIVIDRELFDDNTTSMEERFRKVTPRLVLDVDDAVFLRYPEKFDRLTRMCDLIIAGNRFLKEHLEPLQSNIVVIPTCVDLRTYPQKQGTSPAGKPPVIGWMGTTGNLAYLGVVAEPFRNLARQCEFELRLVAPEDGPLASIDLTGVNVRFVPWRGATEVQELLQFDIGLMPLFAEDEWNRYKCGLKLIQYMGIGIPGVASPVGVNAEIVDHGHDGFLASDPYEWEEILLRLVQDPDLRLQVGTAARETVRERYSIEANLPVLAQALEGSRPGD